MCDRDAVETFDVFDDAIVEIDGEGDAVAFADVGAGIGFQNISPYDS